jgi:hypothetical protein
MLLPKKPDAVEYLASPAACELQSLPKLGILPLELLQPLRSDASGTARCVDRLYPCFGLQSATPECRELVAKMSDERLQLVQCLFVRTFVV